MYEIHENSSFYFLFLDTKQYAGNFFSKKHYRSYCCMVPPQKKFFAKISKFPRGGTILDFFEIFFHSLEIDRKSTIFLYMQIFLHIFIFLAGNAPKNVHFCVRCKNAIKNACFFAPHSSKIHVLLLNSPPQAKFFENRRKNYHFLLIFYSIFGLRPKFFFVPRGGTILDFFIKKIRRKSFFFEGDRAEEGTIQ